MKISAINLKTAMLQIADDSFDPLALLDALPVGVVVHGPDTGILHANAKALSVLRLTAAQALGKETLDFRWRVVDVNHQPLTLEQFPVNRVLATGLPVEGQLLGVVDGQNDAVTWLTANAVAERGPQGRIERVVVTFTENRYARADLPFKDIVDSAQDVVIVTEAAPLQEPGPRIVYVNRAFTELTGYAPEDVMGKSPRFLQSTHTDPAVRARLSEALHAGKSCREVIYNHAKSGRGYWLDIRIVPLLDVRGQVAYFAAIQHDITAEKERADELAHLAFHDALTGLPNRRMLLDRLSQVLHLSRRSGSHLAVVFIDLNRFKHLNDTHGHQAGDLMLVEVAHRLRQRVRGADTVARLGGDEFVVLLPELGPDAEAATQAAARVADELQQALVQPYSLGELRYHASASLGIRVVRGADTSAEHVLNDADAAMYQDKFPRSTP